MTKKSVEKLQDAGYVFIRTRDIPDKCGRINYAIMQSKEFGAWKILEKFDIKTKKKRRLDVLEGLSNIIISEYNFVVQFKIPEQ
jgi:hypothetical protein